ncbi:uncharacterized protein METZ01_LOCUS178204 [marine metagenome]|uniref:Uncharacterized protein n=1 Tax=marine metagenome TaxID=408172 RepID=A0A382CH42_9ZZZZ
MDPQSHTYRFCLIIELVVSKYIIEANGAHIYVDILDGKKPTFSFDIMMISPE